VNVGNKNHRHGRLGRSSIRPSIRPNIRANIRKGGKTRQNPVKTQPGENRSLPLRGVDAILNAHFPPVYGRIS
jgi:hypothetical protein